MVKLFIFMLVDFWTIWDVLFDWKMLSVNKP